MLVVPSDDAVPTAERRMIDASIVFLLVMVILWNPMPLRDSCKRNDMISKTRSSTSCCLLLLHVRT